MGLKNGMVLSVALLSVALTACEKNIRVADTSCLTVGRLYPVCADDYLKDGVKKGSDTEWKLLLTNEWATEICKHPNPCVK